MSNHSDFTDLKHHIESLQAEHPSLAVLAVQTSRNAASSATARRPPADAPLRKVIYKAGSKVILLELATGPYSWRQGTVYWNPNLVDIRVYPNRPRFDLGPVVFEEVPH